MKKFLCILLVVAFSFSFVACTKTYNLTSKNVESLSFVGDNLMKTNFEKIFTLKDIMNDIAKIDIDMEMSSVSALEKKTETAEDGTSIDYYYRGDDCIYAVYNGYSENLWKYFTTSVSGTPLVVSFWDEDEKPVTSIETDLDTLDYSYKVTFWNVDSTLDNGAETVDIEVTKGDEMYKLTIDGNYYFLSEAVYYDEDNNLHTYEAVMEDGALSYHHDDVVAPTTEPVTEEIVTE